MDFQSGDNLSRFYNVELRNHAVDSSNTGGRRGGGSLGEILVLMLCTVKVHYFWTAHTSFESKYNLTGMLPFTSAIVTAMKLAASADDSLITRYVEGLLIV